MRIEDFQDAVDRLGDRLEMWPDDERRGGERLISESERARRILAEARRMRGMIAGTGDIRAPVGLAERILLKTRDGAAVAAAEEVVATPAAASPTGPASPKGGVPLADTIVAARNVLPSLGWRAAFVLPFCFVVGFATALWLSPVDGGAAVPYPLGLASGMVP